MSTYTDLHNRVRENITVDYNNRITPQRVRFFNEQNEYWGTLRGHISAENINVEGGTLHGVTLNDTILNGSVVLPDGIDLYKILNQVKQISADLIATNENLAQETTDRKAEVNEERQQRTSADDTEAYIRSLKDNGLSSAVDNVTDTMQGKIDALRTELTQQDFAISALLSNDLSAERKARTDADSTEREERIAADSAEYTERTTADVTERSERIEADSTEKTAREQADIVEHDARIAADNYLSDAIIDSQADVGREVFDRKIADGKLELSIATEATNSIKRDTDLSLALSAHILDNKEQFDNMSCDVLEMIEHERHYTIYTGTEDAKTTDSWPYTSKDFAVNIYNPVINDGAVYYNDPANQRFEVGLIYKANIGQLYPFTFKTLNGIEHPGVASALNENWAYGFDTDTKTQRTLLNGYSITFDDTKVSHVLSDFNFMLTPTLPQFHKVLYGNIMIGKVTDAWPEDYCDDVLSGLMWFDTTDTELETFNKFRKVSFNLTDLSTCRKETERVTYLGSNKFRLEKNIDNARFIGLNDKLNDQHYQFGRIYDWYNAIPGIVSNDVEITEINVRALSPYNKLVNLNKDTGFKGIVAEDIKSGDIYYNVVLSADVNKLSATFDEVKVSELYKYDFTTIDEHGQEVAGGYVVPRKFNKTMLETLEFDSADINIADVMWITSFKKTYTLTKAAEDLLWTVEDVDTENNILNIKFNGTTIYIKVTSGLDGVIVRQEYPVNVNEPKIFNTDTCHELVYKTDLIDLSYYREEYETPEVTYEVTIDNAITTESFTRYELNIDTEFVGTLKIQVNNRTSPDISREFMVVIKPESHVDTLVNLAFVNEAGDPIQITSSRRGMVLIPTNKWTTLQLKEINNNIFMVIDLDENEQGHDITFLSNAIDVETRNRIENDKYLSDTVDLSVSKLQDQILSNDADIADIYEKIKGGVNYKGTVYCQWRNSSEEIVNMPTISNLFVWNQHGYKAVDTYTEDTVLSNGWMYLVKTLPGSDLTKFVIEGVDIESRDYLIINCRSENPECIGKPIKNLTSADIDVIDAEDADVIHRPELSAVSVFLSANLDNLSTSLSITTSLSIGELQNQIISTDNDIKYLSDAISNIHYAEMSGFTFLSSNIDYISSEVSCNDNDIQYLSNTVDFLLSVDKETMNYKGTLPYLPNLSNDITHEDLGYNYMSTFVMQNMGIHAPNRLKLGDFFRLSAVQSCLYDANYKACWFGAKDYFVFNKDCIVQDIVESDFDVFRNAESEFEWLSAALCADIVELSTSLSNTTKISVEVLQDKIFENADNITYVSSEVSCNDNDISFLSNEVSCNSNNITYVSSEVSCNDNDISFLSNDLSTLKYDHYNKNLSTDIELVHIVPGQTFLSVVDQLLITDEITFDTYRLTIRNGSLNINLVKKFEN